MKSKRGVLLLAYGHKSYIREARNVAATLMLHAPTIPRALVTDAPSEELHISFDEIVPYRPELGSVFEQKLHLDKYSPFEETLFLDVDCLVVRDLSWVFEFFAGSGVGYTAELRTTGQWYGADIADLLANTGLTWLPRHNGGFLYFDRSSESKRFWDAARRYFMRLPELGIRSFRGEAYPDEPAVALGTAECGILPTEDYGRTMRHTAGKRGRIRLDVLDGFCLFQKYGKWVSPSVIHFGRKGTRSLYRREALKARLRVYSGTPTGLTCLIAFTYWVWMIVVGGPRRWIGRAR